MIPITLLVIFLLLSANFQSLRLSLVTVSTAPAVIAGVVLILYLTHTTLNIQSFIGAIMAGMQGGIALLLAGAGIFGLVAFAVTRRDDAALLGAIGFAGLPEMPSVGYWIGRPSWGQGYATEALRLVIGYARHLGAKGLQAETFPDNPASARVLAKCGFRDRGIVRRDHPARGGLTRVHVHVLHFATQDALARPGSA